MVLVVGLLGLRLGLGCRLMLLVGLGCWVGLVARWLLGRLLMVGVPWLGWLGLLMMVGAGLMGCWGSCWLRLGWSWVGLAGLGFRLGLVRRLGLGLRCRLRFGCFGMTVAPGWCW